MVSKACGLNAGSTHQFIDVCSPKHHTVQLKCWGSRADVPALKVLVCERASVYRTTVQSSEYCTVATILCLEPRHQFATNQSISDLLKRCQMLIIILKFQTHLFTVANNCAQHISTKIISILPVSFVIITSILVELLFIGIYFDFVLGRKCPRYIPITNRFVLTTISVIK